MLGQSAFDKIDFCILLQATQNPYHDLIDLEDSDIKYNIVKAVCDSTSLFKQIYMEFDST